MNWSSASQMNPLAKSSIPEPTLVAAQLLIAGLPDAAIRFFASVYQTLKQNDHVSCTEMAKVYGCTPQAASKHLRVLVQRGYMARIHYRAWSLNAERLYFEGIPHAETYENLPRVEGGDRPTGR